MVHLMMCDDEIPCLTGDHDGPLGLVDAWLSIGEDFNAFFFEIVFIYMVRPRPDRKVSTVRFRYIGEIDDGEAGEASAISTHWLAVFSIAHAIDVTGWFARVFTDGGGKTGGRVCAVDGFFEVSFAQ